MATSTFAWAPRDLHLHLPLSSPRPNPTARLVDQPHAKLITNPQLPTLHSRIHRPQLLDTHTVILRDGRAGASPPNCMYALVVPTRAGRRSVRVRVMDRLWMRVRRWESFQ